MSHEQREFSPSTPLRFAYNPESQAIAVYQAQVNGFLKRTMRNVWSWEIRETAEAELKWYEIGGMILCSDDCDKEIMDELVSDVGHLRRLTIISGNFRPDVAFGRPGKIVAAVFTERGKVLYISPGFDLKAYKKKHDLFGKETSKDEE